MRRTKLGVSPAVDILESRELLSTGASPLMSRHALGGVVRDIKAILGTLARTENVDQAGDRLAGLSSRIPAGDQGLAASWQGDLTLYRPNSPGSIVATERRILGDLDRYIQDGGNPPSTGSATMPNTPPINPTPPAQGTAGPPAPMPEPSLDSVRIQNTTGLALLVTVHLEVPQVQQPWITETIPAEGSPIVSFDFGTATDAFMTIDVSLANGGQSPPPLTGLTLSQPMSGYDGTLFSISLLGPYFNVTPRD